MKSFNQLARVAHAAHWMRAHGVHDSEQAKRCWLALPYEQQAPWIKAVEAVYEEVKHIH